MSTSTLNRASVDLQQGSEALPVLQHPEVIAEEAGLRYVTDLLPGIRRIRAGDSFEYLLPRGGQVSDLKTLERIKSLAIPPAYEDVWICPIPNGHLQATGRDAKRRKQYRYHPKWREVRDGNKYSKMLDFARVLPNIRSRVRADISRPGMPREKVLATIVWLLETTHIRVGNEEYARSNHSYGLTTLENDHVEVEKTRVHFHFRGKSGKDWNIDIRDRRLAGIVKRSSELPGQHLFEYVDRDGTPHVVTSSDVNEYIHQIAGDEFTAKDFRTWAGTVLAYKILRECEPVQGVTHLKKNLARAVAEVSAHLGNTPAVCRKCYIHPAVLDAYLKDAMREMLEVDSAGLQPDEHAVVSFLKAHSL